MTDIRGPAAPEHVKKIIIEEILPLAILFCEKTGLCESLEMAKRLLAEWGGQNTITLEEIRLILAQWERLSESEMRKQVFIYMPEYLAKYYQKDKPMGEAVYNAFPSARLDMQEAGSCMACGRNVACTLHLMRAVEVGLRELGRDRQIQSAQIGDIDFKQAGKIIGELETAVKSIQQWPNSYTKEEAQQFYNSALAELRGFNDGWRRHFVHSRQQWIEDDELLALWGHVKRFFTNISSKISEGEYTLLVWH